MLVSLIIRRLRDEVAILKDVHGAATFARAADRPPQRVPAVYVVPATETARPNEMISVISNQVTAEIAVVLVVQNHRDARGEEALDDLDPVRSAVRTALLGWQPAPAFTDLEFSGGRLLSFNHQMVWWQDSYRAETHYRSGPGERET